jgi:C-terminal processing protease CtpA/Prc
VSFVARTGAANLAACLSDLRPDATLIGQPTAGTSGGPSPFTLPRSGAQVVFATIRVLSPGGQWIEGNGILPDQFVRPTRDDIVARREAALAVALSVAEAGTSASRMNPGGDESSVRVQHSASRKLSEGRKP